MDTLKGLIYLETCDKIENWCVAVEDPRDSSKTRIIKCNDETWNGLEKINSNKRGGHWKFKAFRFNGNIKSIETIGRSLSQIWSDIPESCYNQIPLSELKKLDGWID